jgi:uncharacterized protein YecT (DUF1311 family)
MDSLAAEAHCCAIGMTTIVEKILLVLLGAALSGIAYLLKRRIEKKHTYDALERHQKLLIIRKELDEQKVSIEDLRSLESALLKRNAKAENAEKLQHELLPLLKSGDDEFVSQFEMNMRADGNVKIAKAKLEQIFYELSYKLENKEREALEESQKAWEEYSSKHAEFSASSYEGGSIYPLIYLSTVESLVVERTAWLKSELDEIRRLKDL